MAGVEFGVGLALNFSFYEKENPMTKFIFLGVAAVLFVTLAGPATAQHIVAQPAYDVQSGTCLNREPGNPYSKDEDYMAWSAWRLEADGTTTTIGVVCKTLRGTTTKRASSSTRPAVLAARIPMKPNGLIEKAA